MTNFLDAGSQWIAEQLAEHASNPIVITDRETNPTVTIRINATPGQTDWEENTSDGMVHAVATADFTVRADKLRDLFGGPQKLRRGWIVKDHLGQTYAIYSPSGMRFWKYCDASNTEIRIHTKAIDR